MSLKANDRLFDSLSAMSKQHTEALTAAEDKASDTGQYRFEKREYFVEPEPAFKNEAERIYDQRESSSNMADAYTSLCAWAKIFDTAINEKRERDSEAWAEKTAKEINETL